MSEKIFALLLRLYPAAFRRKYQDEVVQLYRDRLHDETATSLKTRLYCGLLLDALAGIPQAWRNSYPETGPSSLANEVRGLAMFHVLDREPLRPGSIVAGAIFSLTVLAAFGVVMRLPAPHRPVNSNSPLSPVEAVLERLNHPVAAKTNVAENAKTSASEVGSSQAKPGSASTGPVAPNGVLSAGERDQVIQAVAQNMSAHYFDRPKAQEVSAKLHALESQGAYGDITDGGILAKRLTVDLRNFTGDRQVSVEYSSNPIPISSAQPSKAAIEHYRSMLIQQNCSVEQAKILPGDLGYLKLNSFPDLAVCGEKLREAITSLRSSNAVIIDLRDNTGGFPETVAVVAAPLFDRAVPWYNPRATPSSTMLAPSPESELANKPLYILTSSLTFSGAEHFTYNLKMLKRATVIGETSGGAAHAGVYHRIDDNFGVGVPEARINNPYGQPDWAGVGVEPDVKVKASDALVVAEKIAAKRLGR